MSYDEDWYTGTPSKGAIQLDIVTDNDTVMLRGTRDEASDQYLTGKVALNLKSTASGKIKLRLSRRIRHTSTIQTAGGSQTKIDLVYHVADIWHESLVAETQKFGPGEYSWPFCITIPADTAASLEGPPTTYVVYRLKCQFERGKFAKDVFQKKHIRVHRTLNPDALELQQAMVTDSAWEGKCAYSISTPTKGIVYGTRVPLEFKIAPLDKGVRPLHIKCSVEQVLRLNNDTPHCQYFKQKEERAEIAHNKVTWPEDQEQDMYGYYTLEHFVPLPNNLSKACQTYKENQCPSIEMRHFVNYRLALSNADGHVSEIQGRLPIYIFFPSAIHVDGTAVSGLPDSSSDPMRVAHDIPPDYAHSHLDLLYDNINMSGYATPAPQSGAMTPRNASYSNMASLLEDDAEAEAEGEDYEAHANALRNRLDNEINPVSAASSPSNEPNANALRSRLEQINLGTDSCAIPHGGPFNAGYSNNGSGSRSNNHSPVRNLSFDASRGHSILSPSANAARDFADPLSTLSRPQPIRSNTYPAPSVTIQPPDSNGSVSPSYSHSHTRLGSATPGGDIRSARPTRPSSPVHHEDLVRVPSYNTAVHTPAATGPYGSQHGGPGLPTYQQVEDEGTSRSGSLVWTGGPSGNASAEGSGAGTPARNGSVGDGMGPSGSGSGAGGRPGGLAERTMSGIWGKLHRKN